MLHDLPPEVLSLILNGDSSWAAIELWKTGNRRLMTNLSNHGIVNVDLSLNTSRPGCRWPACLKEFKLLRLAVRSNVEIASVSRLRRELMGQHVGLLSLSLDIPRALEVLFNLNASKSPSNVTSPPSSNTVASMPRSKRSKHSDIADTKLSDFWSVRGFEKLEVLSITGGADDVQTSLSESAIALISRSVVDLSFSNILDIALKTLPPNLTRLHHRLFKLLDLDSVVDLPKTLQSLTTTQNSFELHAKLHQELPHLELSGDCIGSETAFALFKKTEKWPLASKNVHLSHEGSGPTHVLSPLIQLLLAATLTPEWLTVFPHSLTTLKVRYFDWNSLPSNPIWPNSLTALETCDPAFAACLPKLPRTLKYLLLTCPSLTSPHPADLESHLLEQGLALIQSADAAKWAVYKQSLQEFAVRNGGIFLTSIDSYIDRVEKGGLYGLPIGLTSLKLLQDPSWPSMHVIFPPDVRTLVIGSPRLAESLHFFDRLPPYLSHLEIHAAHISTEHPFENWELFSNPLGSPYFLNMKYLTSASITTNDSCPTGQLLGLLPRCLLKLTLQSTWHHFKAEELQTLPPNLRKFKLYAGSVNPSRAWLHALPRSLTKLTVPIDSLEVHEQDLINCPPSLTSLVINIKVLTYPSLMNLPRSLRRFKTAAKRPLGIRTPPLPILPITSSFLNYATPAEQQDPQFNAINLLKTSGWHHVKACYVPFWKIFTAPIKDLRLILSAPWPMRRYIVQDDA